MLKMIQKIFINNNETIVNFVWRSLQVFGKQGITFIIFFICARYLNIYDFGVYNYLITTIFFLIMFGDFGISTATAKFVADWNFTNNHKMKSVLFNSGLMICGVSAVIVVLTLMIGPSYLKNNFFLVVYLLPLIFLAPLTSLYDGIYRGLKRFRELAFISLVAGFISLGPVYFLVTSYGLIGALISQNLFYLLLLVLLSLSFKEYNFQLERSIMKEIGTYSLSVGISVLGYYLFSRVGVMILGYFNYINEIAVYELLNKIFTVLLMPLTVLSSVLFPYFTELDANRKHNEILETFRRYSVIFFFIAIFFTVFVYFLIPIVIDVFFYDYYNDTLFKMLLPVILIYSSQIYCGVVSSSLIVATGYARLLSVSNVIAGVANVILSLLLEKQFGYIGVIYSILFLHIAMIVITHRIYYLKIKALI